MLRSESTGRCCPRLNEPAPASLLGNCKMRGARALGDRFVRAARWCDQRNCRLSRSLPTAGRLRHTQRPAVVFRRSGVSGKFYTNCEFAGRGPRKHADTDAAAAAAAAAQAGAAAEEVRCLFALQHLPSSLSVLPDFGFNLKTGEGPTQLWIALEPSTRCACAAPVDACLLQLRRMGCCSLPANGSRKFLTFALSCDKAGSTVVPPPRCHPALRCLSQPATRTHRTPAPPPCRAPRAPASSCTMRSAARWPARRSSFRRSTRMRGEGSPGSGRQAMPWRVQQSMHVEQA